MFLQLMKQMRVLLEQKLFHCFFNAIVDFKVITMWQKL